MTYVNGTRCGRKLTIYIVGFFFVLELKKEIAFAISQTNIKYYDLFFLLSNIAPATVIIEIQLAIDVASPVLAGFLS